MAERFSPDQIFRHWTGRAVACGDTPEAGWSDLAVVGLETREILKHLEDGDRVLDLGCANGYKALALVEGRNVCVRGLDCVPEMVAAAERLRAGRPLPTQARLSFGVGDITDLGAEAGQWDKVVVVRVLINLGTWDRQKLALAECARALRPGGVLLLSEAFVQGWARLNDFRREWGLPDIPMPPFNAYLDLNQLLAAADPDFELLTLSDFASTYYVGTRVFKPLLARLAGLEALSADPGAEWNRWWATLPAWGDYGTQKLLALRRR